MSIARFSGKTLKADALKRLDFEPLGTKEKVWVYFEDTPEKKYLIKFSRENTGEHWSEYIACKLCEELNIPCAKYEILPCEINSQGEKRMAVVSENLNPIGSRMIMGNEFLHQKFPDTYPLPEETHNKRWSQHTVAMVKESLNDVKIKIEWGFPVSFSAFDVFCGYLLLDALISNQDRHHENWAVLYKNENEYFLCESYDHAASLGRELTPEKRETLLTSKDKGQQLGTFVQKARSEIFKNATDRKPLLTVDAVKEALNYCLPETTQFWISQLTKLTEQKIENILEQVSEQIMDQKTKHFVLRMILENKARILNNVR